VGLSKLHQFFLQFFTKKNLFLVAEIFSADSFRLSLVKADLNEKKLIIPKVFSSPKLKTPITPDTEKEQAANQIDNSFSLLKKTFKKGEPL